MATPLPPPPPPAFTFQQVPGVGAPAAAARACGSSVPLPCALTPPACSPFGAAGAGVLLPTLLRSPLGASPLSFPSLSLWSPPFPSTCFLRKRASSWSLLRSWGHGGSGPRRRRLRGGTPAPVLQKGGAEAEGGPRSEEPQVHRSFLQAANLLQSLYRLHLVREADWGRGLEEEGT